MTEDIVQILNSHINKRFNFSYICIAVSTWFEKQKLRGIANWIHVQYLQENNNTLNLIKHLVEKDFPLKFNSINHVNEFWNKKSEAFDFLSSIQIQLLEETKHIADIASEINDSELYQFMVKYKNHHDDIVDSICQIKEDLVSSEHSENKILSIDNELSSRVYISY